jgi:pimeloyl-ACP methyl ester carboxylesterase
MENLHCDHKYLLVGGHRLAYLDEGSGPPILLIHGIPTSIDSWIEEAAHWVMEEKPAQVAAELTAFLD